MVSPEKHQYRIVRELSGELLSAIVAIFRHGGPIDIAGHIAYPIFRERNPDGEGDLE